MSQSQGILVILMVLRTSINLVSRSTSVWQKSYIYYFISKNDYSDVDSEKPFGPVEKPKTIDQVTHGEKDSRVKYF